MAKVKITASTSIKRKSRKNYGFRLTELASKRVDELARQAGVSRSEVIEQLIMSAQVEK